MRIHVNNSLKDYINCYRNNTYSLTERVSIFHTIRDKYKNHNNLQKSSSNVMPYYSNFPKLAYRRIIMPYHASFKDNMFCSSRNGTSFSDLSKGYYYENT